MLMISANQIRAARGLLKWPQKTLASKANLSVATLRQIEHDDKNITALSATKIREVFEHSGLEFFENDGVGFLKDSIKVYRGMHAQDMLYDQFEIAKESNKTVHMTCRSLDAMTKFLGLDNPENIKRFRRISKNMNVDCLLSDASNMQEQSLSFRFRAYTGLFAAGACHCFVNNRYIIAKPEDNGGYIYIVLTSFQQYESFFAEFLPMWKLAIPLSLTASNDASEPKAVAASSF